MKLSEKTLAELIEHYIKQVDITSKIDYLDKKTVRANSKAVNTMYEIVKLIDKKFGAEGINQFSELLDRRENSAYLWAAAQLLEKMNPNDITRKKALKIIKEIASSNHPSTFGF